VIRQFIERLVGSLDNHSKNSFSARKLSGLAGVIIGYFLTLEIQSDEHRFYALCAWLIFVLLCLSIITAAQIISVYHEKNNTTPPTDSPVSKL